MAFLRLGSTRRVVGLLVAAFAALVALAVVAGGAFGGGGSAPPAKPLAQAIHDSLGGPKVDGVTARVDFTSHLFDGATTDTSSALLTGGSGRLWAAPGKLRLELQSDNGDAQIVFADGKGFVYDGPSDTAYTFAAKPRQQDVKQKQHNGTDSVPTVGQIQQRLSKFDRKAAVDGPQAEVVAGQPAYEVRVTPRSQGGLIGGAALAWDAVRGVPLKFGIYARGASSPAVELTVTDIAYGAVDPSVFDVTPPGGANVVDLGGGGGAPPAKDAHPKAPTFSAIDPATLGPRARRSVKRAGDGYVVLYGKGLDTVAVFEHVVKAGEKPPVPRPQGGHDGPSLQLPTTSINGARATEFGTPLGGLVRFERAGVSYTVVGSQPLSVLEAAARGL